MDRESPAESLAFVRHSAYARSPMGSRRDTPAMRQYDAFKKQYPDCILFFRMGDFYEMFDEDAVRAHKALGITLTERTPGIPMAGVPYHSMSGYLAKLIEHGFRVAVCDQVQDPKEAKGVVERAVTRVITPGTLVDEALLTDDRSNHLAAAAFLDPGDAPTNRVALAIVELSTGTFTIIETTGAGLIDELARRDVSELLYCEPSDGQVPPRVKRVLTTLGLPGTPRPIWHFRFEEAREALLTHYGIASLAGFGLRDDDATIPAAGVIIRYLTETQALHSDVQATSNEHTSSGTSAANIIRSRSLAHLAPPRREIVTQYLTIDATGLRALEVERTIRTGSSEGSLLGVFSRRGVGCRTPMGRRLLRDWLCAPLFDRARIEQRHRCVGALVQDARMCEELRLSIRDVQDVARIMARVALGRATPRDLVAVGASLRRVDDVVHVLRDVAAFDTYRSGLEGLRDDLTPIAEEIVAWCVDHPPSHLREGGLIRDGVDAELDEARALQRESSAQLAAYQAELVERYDLPSLKVGYNKVFGYYIELPRAQAKRAPDEFTRKQTLKNAERYITPHLKDFEERVLSAGDRAIMRENTLFCAICDRLNTCHGPAVRFAQTVAELDVLLTFAIHASLRNWSRPEMHDEPVLHVTQGRHPVLEELLAESGADGFVPNDVTLGTIGEEPAPALALITGPNMAGKSTFIRQVALIVLLAHAGSFVPAEGAAIGMTDRIFTRVGADDALHAGQSTFMVEMTETASILHNATAQSLIILDEIGRGTSTLDGLALAWAITESLARPLPFNDGAISPRTLFATHYHELTDLQEQMPDLVRNLHVAVREWGEEIIFLHRILPGRANRSYGIHVARLAGMPSETVRRADALLETLAVSHQAGPVTPREPRAEPIQLGLFTEYVPHPLLERLRELKLDGLTPLQAFDILRACQQEAGSTSS